MRRAGQIALWVAGGLAAAALLLGGNTLRSYFGVMTNPVTPQELSALLSPAYDIRLPEGGGRFPTALLFSGCDGPQDNLDRLAASLNAAGWAAVIVDSHGPRGFSDANVWRLVCSGQILTGAERAGDVAVALADVRAMPFADPGRLAVIGASHGGWAILDLLALQSVGTLPYNLTAWPTDIEDVLAGVQAAILFYPYCGPGAQVGRLGWTAAIPVLFLLVQNDSVADEADCQQIVTRMQDAGRNVEQHLIEGVTHGFDQQDKAAFSLLRFDAAATAQAHDASLDFLARHGPADEE